MARPIEQDLDWAQDALDVGSADDRAHDRALTWGVSLLSAVIAALGVLTSNRASYLFGAATMVLAGGLALHGFTRRRLATRLMLTLGCAVLLVVAAQLPQWIMARQLSLRWATTGSLPTGIDAASVSLAPIGEGGHHVLFDQRTLVVLDEQNRPLADHQLSSPIDRVIHGDGAVFLVETDQSLIAYDDRGEHLWSRSVALPRATTVQAISGDLITMASNCEADCRSVTLDRTGREVWQGRSLTRRWFVQRQGTQPRHVAVPSTLIASTDSSAAQLTPAGGLVAALPPLEMAITTRKGLVISLPCGSCASTGAGQLRGFTDGSVSWTSEVEIQVIYQIVDLGQHLYLNANTGWYSLRLSDGAFAVIPGWTELGLSTARVGTGAGWSGVDLDTGQLSWQRQPFPGSTLLAIDDQLIDVIPATGSRWARLAAADDQWHVRVTDLQVSSGVTEVTSPGPGVIGPRWDVVLPLGGDELLALNGSRLLQTTNRSN